jgi:hypothetical protein
LILQLVLLAGGILENRDRDCKKNNGNKVTFISKLHFGYAALFALALTESQFLHV